MADKKKMSIEDILAACRGTGGAASPSGGVDESATTAKQPDESASKPVSKPVSPPAGGTSGSSSKPAAQLSVADILAAARGTGAPAPSADAKADQEPRAAAPAKAAPAKGAGAMSVSDILAAARGTGGPEAAKPAPKTAAAKPKSVASSTEAAVKPATAKPTGPMDTSSILAAARKDAKPGPVSKAEAASKAAGPVARSKPLLPPMPEKPAYAKPKTATASATATDRRGFFSVFLGSFLAVGFTTLGLTSLSWTLGLARFLFPNILMEPPSRFKVGFPNDFAPGSVADRFKAQFGIWIVSTEYEGMPQIVALRTVCTHLGCTPNWLEAEQKFKCPCHGSGFYKDGVNFEGPAPRPLERYAIRLADDGQLEVDKSKMFQQEMGQWSDPACYVPV